MPKDLTSLNPLISRPRKQHCFTEYGSRKIHCICTSGYTSNDFVRPQTEIRLHNGRAIRCPRCDAPTFYFIKAGALRDNIAKYLLRRPKSAK